LIRFPSVQSWIVRRSPSFIVGYMLLPLPVSCTYSADDAAVAENGETRRARAMKTAAIETFRLRRSVCTYRIAEPVKKSPLNKFLGLKGGISGDGMVATRQIFDRSRVVATSPFTDQTQLNSSLLLTF